MDNFCGSPARSGVPGRAVAFLWFCGVELAIQDPQR